MNKKEMEEVRRLTGRYPERTIVSLDSLQEIFRGHLLVALDSAAVEAFSLAGLKCGAGASDADLPRLFEHLDIQIRELVGRYEITIAED